MSGKKEDTGEKFFGIVGGCAILFGVGVTVFDLMFDPIRSAILSLAFIMVGSLCLMVAAAKFLKRMDKKFFSLNKDVVEKQAAGESDNKTPAQDPHVKKTQAQRSEAAY